MAGMVAFAMLSPRGSAWARRAGMICRAYAVPVISFSVVHWLNLRGVATWVPRWLPPGQMFWSVTTAVCFLLAAAAILTGVMAGLATRLLAAMILGFEVLVWAPRLIARPHVHFEWAGNVIGLAMAAGAWMVADGVRAAQQE